MSNIQEKEILCIYHGNCADGFGAAWAVGCALGRDYVEFYPGTFQEPPPCVIGRTVFLVDFSYKKDVMLELIRDAKSVTIIDHHKSAQEELQPLLDEELMSGIFDMNKSGAVLAWEWFFPDQPPPQLLLHIQDRDLWKFELDGTREIQAAVFSYDYDFDLWDKLVYSTSIESLFNEGVTLARKQSGDIKEFSAIGIQRMTIAGHDVPVLNLPYFWSSEAGNILAQGEKFAACYWDQTKYRVFSLRSTDSGLDVSEIASQFGGGGHRNAAGFSVPHGKYELHKVSPDE